MPEPSYDTLKSAFAAQPLFEDKTWRLSPEAWPLTPDAGRRSWRPSARPAWNSTRRWRRSTCARSPGKNLLRNKPLARPWVADYLDRGKPAGAGRPRAATRGTAGCFPTVLRPDLLLTDEGFVMTELDSVPGGIGLTAFLNRLYRDSGGILGADDAMIRNFHASLAGAPARARATP